MTLIENLKSYNSDYWDFSQYREKDALVRYPATMVAPMQEQLLYEILENDKAIKNIMDPFSGSGTILSIGNKFGLDVFGIDINPLAILISRVKLEGVSLNDISKSIKQIKAHIALLLGNIQPHSFTNIKKWFREDVINDLSLIRKAIQLEKNIINRRYFWVCFADTIRKYGNTRSTTFKLHTKTEEKIQDMENDCIEYFINHISINYKNYIFPYQSNSIDLKTGDANATIEKMDENSVDLICTSPPYGDNHTTVTYGQYSILPLLWIDSDDLDPFDHNLLSKFTQIDSLSLGGRYVPNISDSLFKDLLTDLSYEKKKKVKYFFHDYCNVFYQMARVLKPGKRMVLTLGNRRVDNKEIPFNILNDRLAHQFKLESELVITRKILGKRMPLKVSHLPECGSVVSMNKEYITIYKKKESS
jgi:DNA modification methylase